jgi:hypothetical protein
MSKPREKIEDAATGKSLLRRTKHISSLVVINVAVFIALFVLFELAVHIIWREENPWLTPPFTKSKVRIANPIYGHTLIANFEGQEVWGSARTKIITNSLGFKSARGGDVPLRSNDRRILFLGDSFTEGVGLPYEGTFVGRFAAALPQLDVLNAAASSYAPSVYYAKMKYLLDLGLQVDEVIVYIDLSDIQDEATAYRTGDDGRLEEGDFDKECPSPTYIVRLQSPWWARFSYVLDLFYKQRVIMSVIRNPPNAEFAALAQPKQIYARDFARGAWTYDSGLPCYGTMGVEGGIAKAVAQMDKLYALLSEKHIPLSVGVYPWPQQLLYDKEESRQVTLWRDWCEKRCRRFLNHFPALFAYKHQNPNFLRNLFFWGDYHYNSLGNEIIARDLVAQYSR